MRRILRLRPSPAMVIAVGALIAALGGTSIAAGPLASDSKAPSISGKRLKNRSITRTKIKKNTLTGTEIKESKLGKVPSAALADTATKAKTADTATTLAGKSLSDFVAATKVPFYGPLELSNGERKDIAKFGPFTFTASCEINIDAGGGPPLDDRARILISTSADNAALAADSYKADFDTSTPEDQRVWASDVEDHGTAGLTPAYYQVATAPDGTQVSQPGGYVGSNLFGHSDKCQFGGTFLYG